MRGSREHLVPVHDVVLHPFQARSARPKYVRILREFEELLAAESDPAQAEERRRHGLQGKIHFPDAFVLKRLLEKQRPAAILEIGSFLGFSTRWMLEVSTPWGAKLTSVDPNIRHRVFDAPAEVLRKFNARFLPERLEIVQAFFGNPGACSYEDYEQYEPVRSRAEVDELMASRPRIGSDWTARFDFIFIDGDHEESAVIRDFEMALRLLRPGGCIALHDTFWWPDVERAMKRIRATYGRRARITNLGRLDNQILRRFFGKPISGIGVFAPKGAIEFSG